MVARVNWPRSIPSIADELLGLSQLFAAAPAYKFLDMAVFVYHKPEPPPFEQLCLTEHVSSIRVVHEGVRTTITEVRG